MGIVSGRIDREAAPRPMLEALVDRQDDQLAGAAQAALHQDPGEVRLGPGIVRFVMSENGCDGGRHHLLLSVLRASTPGRGLPSIHSRKAPPAVETKVKSSATPAWLSAATVSPPPATDTSEPSLVNAAAVFASATVAASKGGVSNAPSGPLHTRVRQVLSTSASASTAAGPMSRIISSGATSCTLQVRRLGGLGANSFATTTSYGKWIVQPASSARSKIAFASPASSCSHSDLPTFTPRAARKVLAMPPPMIR